MTCWLTMSMRPALSMAPSRGSGVFAATSTGLMWAAASAATMAASTTTTMVASTSTAAGGRQPGPIFGLDANADKV